MQYVEIRKDFSESKCAMSTPTLLSSNPWRWVGTTIGRMLALLTQLISFIKAKTRLSSVEGIVETMRAALDLPLGIKRTAMSRSLRVEKWHISKD
jgi:hypothetical protein